MAYINPTDLDATLNSIKNAATALHFCTAEPSDRTTTLTLSVGNKATPAITGPTDRGGGGREVTASAFADGVVTAIEPTVVTHWAIISADRLLAADLLATSETLVPGKAIQSTAFTIGVTNPT